VEYSYKKLVPHEEWVALLTEARRNGLSPSDLAKLVNKSIQTICDAENRTGIKLVRKTKHVADWIEALLWARAQRWSLQEAAERLGVSCMAIIKAERRHGIYLKRLRIRA
jgi:DNA-binding XRE family transcriptional regulator